MQKRQPVFRWRTHGPLSKKVAPPQARRTLKRIGYSAREDQDSRSMLVRVHFRWRIKSFHRRQGSWGHMQRNKSLIVVRLCFPQLYKVAVGYSLERGKHRRQSPTKAGRLSRNRGAFPGQTVPFKRRVTSRLSKPAPTARESTIFSRIMMSKVLLTREGIKLDVHELT